MEARAILPQLGGSVCRRLLLLNLAAASATHLGKQNYILPYLPAQNGKQSILWQKELLVCLLICSS